MKKTLLVGLLVCLQVLPAVASDGMVDVLSAFSVQETADRLERVLSEKKMTLFNRIRHSESASKVGVELRETELILFGNPKVGSPLMKCQQRVAIDLPQKALIWKDDRDRVWVSYNNPRYLEKKHKINGCEAVIAKIEKALAGIAKAAATK